MNQELVLEYSKKQELKGAMENCHGSSQRGKACPGKNGKTGKAAGGSEESGGKTQRAGTAEAPGPFPESR